MSYYLFEIDVVNWILGLISRLTHWLWDWLILMIHLVHSLDPGFFPLVPGFCRMFSIEFLPGRDIFLRNYFQFSLYCTICYCFIFEEDKCFPNQILVRCESIVKGLYYVSLSIYVPVYYSRSAIDGLGLWWWC